MHLDAGVSRLEQMVGVLRQVVKSDHGASPARAAGKADAPSQWHIYLYLPYSRSKWSHPTLALSGLVTDIIILIIVCGVEVRGMTARAASPPSLLLLPLSLSMSCTAEISSLRLYHPGSAA